MGMFRYILVNLMAKDKAVKETPRKLSDLCQENRLAKPVEPDRSSQSELVLWFFTAMSFRRPRPIFRPPFAVVKRDHKKDHNLLILMIR